MTRNEIKEKLVALCVEIFQDSRIDSDLIERVDFTDDLGMDSILFITMIVEIEAAFAITVPDDLLLMENFKSINNIVDIIVDILKT